MKITQDQILHVADLARLHLTPEEADAYARQVGAVLEYMDKLGEVDTDGIKPTAHAIPKTNAFREDKVLPSLPADQALANAPEREDQDFIVPRVI